MSVRKVLLAVFATLVLFTNAAFSFPYDPYPSTIQPNSGGIPGFSGFTGNWTNTVGSMTVDQLRVNMFMIEEFAALGGSGGSIDLKIWDSPSFNPEKRSEDQATFEHLINNPGQNVPDSVGRASFTTHKEMIDFIEAMPRDNLTVVYLGEIPRGFPFPLLIFSTEKDRSPAGLAASGKPLVWIQGLIHGGEWSGGEGMLTLANCLAKGRYNNYLKDVNVVMTPRVCADGAKAPRRETHDILALRWTATPEARDLNRDHLLLDIPVSRAMKKMFVAYAPHFAVDLHERGNTNINANVTSRFGVKIDNDAGDVGSAGATQPQFPRDFLALRFEYLERDLAKFAEQYGLYFGLYREGIDVYAHGNYTSFQADWTPIWGETRWNPLPGEPTGGIHADANLVNSFVTNSSWDPDAPYWVISETQFNTRNSRNNNAMPGVISQLFENKSGSGKVMWERRVATGYVCALSTIATAANRRNELMPILTNMRKAWIEKGKTVTKDDMVTILPLPPRPVFWNDAKPEMGYSGKEAGYTVIDITGLPTTVTSMSIREGVKYTTRYDATKAMKHVGPGMGLPGTKNGAYVPVSDDSGTRDYQMFKFIWNWLGTPMRERMRPYAYLMDGPYAMEIATRMSLNGIIIKRLAADMEIEVEAWKFNQRPYINNADSGSGGWRNRDVTLYDTKKLFKKDDTFVIYLAQPLIHFVPNYLEPDMPWNAASCIYLPYMSLALGGPGSGYLHTGLIGMEMPAYRYLKTVDLPTYDMNHYTPLINRGAVVRFYKYQTQESTVSIAAACKEKHIKVYDYDIQVHTRTDALRNGRFDFMLPTNKNTKGYLILRKDGTYQALTPHSTVIGWNIATVVVADHGNDPFTVDLDASGRPVVVDGANRTLAHALPPNDDLIGVRIVEIVYSPIEIIFKDMKLPLNSIETEKGIEYLGVFTDKATLLSDTMLDGWRIIGVNPTSSRHWRASITNGNLVVTFHGESFNQKVTVTLVNDATSETMELEIKFSGEHSIGCNAGFAALALFAFLLVFLRKRH